MQLFHNSYGDPSLPALIILHGLLGSSDNWHSLGKRLGELPKRKEIVAYCRGPYCLMSYDAVELLRKKGHKARRLENGLPEWRLAGLPVEGA